MVYRMKLTKRLIRFLKCDRNTKKQMMLIKFHLLQRKKIVFDNFNGKGYGDNPKYISEEIIRQNLNWDIVWLVKDNSVKMPPNIRTVICHSEQARRELLTAKVVVSNIRNSMRMPKRKGQVFLQTWHGGMAFKKVEGEAEEKLTREYINCAKRDGEECDAIISACALRSEQYRKYFWLNPKTEILEIGQPRCDILFSNCSNEIIVRVRNTLYIERDTGIILYAPTFRDNGSTKGYCLDFEKIISAFEIKFHKKFIILVRLHPNAESLCDFIEYSDKILNATFYPDIQELYIVSNFLITDYSGAAFDFALLNKPVFLCTLDYEEFVQERGLSELYQICPFPKCCTNNELISLIYNFSESDFQEALLDFKTIWKPFDDGKAAERAVNWIKQHV